jgi:high-affinity iron transporter
VRGRFICSAAVALGLLVGAGHAAAATAAPWQTAADLRLTLADAQKALVLGDRAEAGRLVGRARALTLGAFAPIGPDLRAADGAVRADDPVSLEVARTRAWTTVLGIGERHALRAIRRGNAGEARSWLLVREYRKPTRFSRPGADATLAVSALARGRMNPRQAVAVARADLLDTYQSRLRAALEAVDDAGSRGFDVRRSGSAAMAEGYFAIIAGSYARQRGRPAQLAATRAFARLSTAAAAGRDGGVRSARAEVDRRLEGFRAAPLSKEETLRRAGQLQRFISLVPVEYARGVDGGRVMLDFEVQEAVTFRDGASQAFGELEAALAVRDRAATRRLALLLAGLGHDLGAAARHTSVADPEIVKRNADSALALIDDLYPEEWKGAGATADFDVISGTLDRLEGAVAAEQYSRAEQARLEAYAFFEFGPEQRLRGLAPDLFVRVEGLFWYGADGLPGLAQLVKRRSDAAEVGATRRALDTALADAESAVGSGPTSTFAVVSNTAVIVFREGLEAVLILAVLLAGMVGSQRRLRRPLLLGAAAAVAASAATWAVAQTVLSSLSRYGERLEAVVSLIAIGVLLLVLNWFYHRVYWTEHLAGLHGRKKHALGLGGLAAAAGLVMLGFTSVYREGFETVLFLQALVLEAGVPTVLLGVAIGAAATFAVGLLTIAFQQKLPHKKMLIGTGVLILWVLVVMVGTTVQNLQVAGWMPVTPVEGLRLPYWTGLWLGIFPTWEGLIAQCGAAAFVVGSYLIAEQMRKRRRRVIVAAAVSSAR